MTEPTPTEGATGTESKRGRPRPDSTVQRDASASTHFTEAGAAGLTREALAEKLGVTPSEAYLSIYRLSRTTDETVKIGKTRAEGKTVWKLTQFLVVEAPAEPAVVA